MRWILAFALLSTAIVQTAQGVSIPTVLIGNPGNPDQPGYNVDAENPALLRGGVNYEYRIGKYEVTIGQYSEFLNAVAAADPNQLWHSGQPGIQRSGSVGSFSYTVIGSPDKPITNVSNSNALRFVNWLHNGQPSGPQNASTTEDGAYTFSGPEIVGPRNSGASWFLPTEDEWYKAAYWDPVAQHYWEYPTGTNSRPYSDQPPGSGAPTPANTANYFENDRLANGYNDGYAATGSSTDFVFANLTSYLTDVGAYSSSVSPYGTYDQGGNAEEWTETAYFSSLSRRVLGGSFGSIGPGALHGRNDRYYPMTDSDYRRGFRVGATVIAVPEPSALALAAVALVGLVALSRRKRA